MPKPEIVLHSRVVEDSRGEITLIENITLVDYLVLVKELYGRDLPITAFTRCPNNILARADELNPVEIASEVEVVSVDRKNGTIRASSPPYFAHGGNSYVLTKDQGIALARLYIQTPLTDLGLSLDFKQAGWKKPNREVCPISPRKLVRY